MQSKITLIREKCIARNPPITLDIALGKFQESRRFNAGEVAIHYGRPIRLADVLLTFSKATFPKAENIVMKEVGDIRLTEYWEGLKDIVRRWDLLADDLEKQSEETINFLYELLRE